MKTVTLKITESQWSGWARSQPPPTERGLLLAEEETFALTFHGEQHICAVTRIEADAVELSPVGNAPALVIDGGIGPNRMASPTSLALGQSLKVSTWALDVGANWEITVESIQT